MPATPVLLLPRPPQPIRWPHSAAEDETDLYNGWSPKMRRRMSFDNRNEFHHWLLLEGTPEAAQLCEQYPEAAADGWHHVFDMWIRWRDGHEECREVIPASRLIWTPDGKRVPPDWAYVIEWCREHGYTCSFITDVDLDTHNSCIYNWRRLMPLVQLGDERADEALEHAVLDAVARAGTMRLGDLIMGASPVEGAHMTAVVACLLHRGRLVADLDLGRFGPDLVLGIEG